MLTLHGRWGDRLTSLFSLRRPAQWLLANICVPVVNVTDFIGLRKWQETVTTTATDGYLVVPSGKRWFVFWAQGRNSASGAQNLFLESSGAANQILLNTTAAGTRVASQMQAYMDEGDQLRLNTDTSGDLYVTALVFEYDVEQP